jgi:dTDP-4-amino-4,6-dideoxygalactose transaminase
MENSINIPCLDLKKQYLTIKDEVLKITEEVFSQTAFSGGPFVEKFENSFATFCDTKYALGCNNGTTALHLAMLALDIKPGDEVIIPANTFIATAWGVSYVGATPVFVDCDPNTWEIDVEAAEKAITPKTKAIIGVHLYGQPFDIAPLKAICDKHKIFLVEDAAQAQGAKYNGKPVGGFGELATFSFYPGKNLGAFGEAGGLTTNNETYLKHMQRLRNHGMTVRYYHEEIGYNYRMDGLQGGILEFKLGKLESWNNRRREIAKMYQDGIKNEKIKLQTQPENTESIYHLFVVTTEDRDGFMGYLNTKNIFPGLHYPVPCHLQDAYKYLGYKKGDFPHTEYLSEHCLSLPMFPELTDEEVNIVIDAVNLY